MALSHHLRSSVSTLTRVTVTVWFTFVMCRLPSRGGTLSSPPSFYYIALPLCALCCAALVLLFVVRPSAAVVLPLQPRSLLSHCPTARAP